MRRACGLLLAAVLLLAAAGPVQPAELEGFEDEPEVPAPKSIPVQTAQPVTIQPAQAQPGDPTNPAAPKVQLTETAQPGDELTVTPGLPAAPRTWQDLLYRAIPEFIGLLMTGIFLYNMIQGRKKNEAIAIKWAKTFCSDGQVMDRNFSQLTLKDSGATEVLVRESRAEFLFYASGRRFCQSLTARIDLRRRQDLLSVAYYQFTPRDDLLDLEIVMNDSCMPPLVLAVAQKRLGKPLLKAQPDVATFARQLEVTRDRIATWPSEELVVYAEHPSIFYDLMSEQLLEQLFSKEAWPLVHKWFRYMHFTSEPENQMNNEPYRRPKGAPAKRVLRFSFTIPPPDRMEEQHRLLAAACHCIDVVGTYARDGSFGPEHRKRAEQKRQEIEKQVFKEKQAERQETAEERRQKKAAEEAERVKRMTPQQRAKYKEKQEKLQMKRQMRGRTVKM